MGAKRERRDWSEERAARERERERRERGEREEKEEKQEKEERDRLSCLYKTSREIRISFIILK